MTAISNQPTAARRPAGACRASCLALWLLSALAGCATVDPPAAEPHTLAVRDHALQVQPSAGQRVRRLPTPPLNASTQLGVVGGKGPVPPGVQLASFQDPARQIPAEELPAEELPAQELPAQELPARELPARELPARQIPGGVNASNPGPAAAIRPLQPAKRTQAAAAPPSEMLSAPAANRTSLPAGDDGSAASNQDGFPIDLATALRLAGANNLHIALAAERVEQALARAQASRAKWLPSLNAGISYNKHAGRIQLTEGEVIEANRGSLFVGGGVGLAGTPLNGGSGGPPRLFVDMSVADLLFEPLAARQMVDVAAATQSAIFNRQVLEAALAYQRLVHAHALTAIYEEAVVHATRLVEITEGFARAGEGYPADAERARADLARRQGELLQADEAVDDASTALALVLRLDPATRLVPTDREMLALDLLHPQQPLESLVAQAIAARPDLESAEMLANASAIKADLEQWRPWLPHLYAGFSGGGFGGSDQSDLKAFSDRSDFDIAAVWQLENFGFGNAARRRDTESQHRQAHLAADQLRDQVAAEVTTAFHRTNSRRQQIDVATPQITAASNSLSLNFSGIRGGVLRPIETQQAIGALIEARARYLNAMARYNVAQFQLLHAIGLPPYLPDHAPEPLSAVEASLHTIDREPAIETPPPVVY